MFRTRPPWFALTCVSIWLLHLVFLTIAFYGNDQDRKSWALVTLGVSMALGAMLLVQLPRALQWRPRLSARPSSEILAERRRIARDLHDNLGSQLVCALSLIRTSTLSTTEVRVAIEKCLFDLRLIVDCMDSVDASLTDRLAQLRHRIAPVLAQRRIIMKWEIEEPPSGASFPYPDSAKHLVAIAQEALSNSLQHAQATEIHVRTWNVSSPDALCMEICDNGQGIATPSSKEKTPIVGGYGVASMTRRAYLAGGELQVLVAEQGGTCVRVVTPYAAVR